MLCGLASVARVLLTLHPNPKEDGKNIQHLQPFSSASKSTRKRIVALSSKVQDRVTGSGIDSDSDSGRELGVTRRNS